MKNQLFILSSILTLSFVLAGCASIPPQSPEALKVIVSPNPPPKGCKYVGAVVGNQGNFLTGGFTSNKNLEEGSLNVVRNKAADLGANYVQMVTNRAGVTASISSYQGDISGGSQETNVVATGNAYKCPPASIGE